MNLETTDDWARALRAAAAASLGPSPVVPVPAEFCDEYGHHRPADEPFFRWLAARGSPPDARVGAAPREVFSRADSPEVYLWRALTEDLSLAFLRPARSVLDLIPSAGSVALEVTTEAQLCALHALTHLARREPLLRPLVDRSVSELIAEVQPDNATNHPWAIHAFAAWSLEPGVSSGPEARLYAETLLHNAVVARGRPDARSAWILLDAAHALAVR